MKLGILSAGRIVSEFLVQFQKMDYVEVTGICARPQSEEKGRALAERFGIPRVYTDYDRFLTENDMDAVYIGSANHMHYPQAKVALLAGHNVILEKPMTGTLTETEELFALAEEKGVKLMEAITTFYLPGFAFMKEHLEEIEPVRMVMANFSKQSSQYELYLSGKIPPSFSPECLGGSLNDLNVYNLHLVLGLVGAPLTAEYLPNIGASGVDNSGAAVLRYEGFSALLTAGKDSGAPAYCHIQGENGSLELEGAPNCLGQVRLCKNGTVTEGPSGLDETRMWEEFAAFDKMVKGEAETLYRAAREQSLLVMRVLDELHKTNY